MKRHCEKSVATRATNRFVIQELSANLIALSYHVIHIAADTTSSTGTGANMHSILSILLSLMEAKRQ